MLRLTTQHCSCYLDFGSKEDFMSAQTQKKQWTRTFKELRVWAVEMAGVSNHFDFCRLGPDYKNFWDKINCVEFDRGYDPVEYIKPDTPALWQMKLLTDEEFEEWKSRFLSFHK